MTRLQVGLIYGLVGGPMAALLDLGFRKFLAPRFPRSHVPWSGVSFAAVIMLGNLLLVRFGRLSKGSFWSTALGVTLAVLLIWVVRGASADRTPESS